MNTERFGCERYAVLACLLTPAWACSDVVLKQPDQNASPAAPDTATMTAPASRPDGNMLAAAGSGMTSASAQPQRTAMMASAAVAVGGTAGAAGRGSAQQQAGTSASSAAAAGSGAMPGTQSAGNAGSAPVGSAKDHADLGKGDGTDVITIGDSWMAGIAPQLRSVSTQSYRDYSVGGAPLLAETAMSGFMQGRSTIVEQYENALKENSNVKTVVATAGGIDTLEGPGQGAEGNMKLESALTMLFAKMAADGVQDIVYYAYSRSQGDSIEMLYQTQTKVCDASPVRCFLIDSDTIIMGMLGDGIHPTTQGSTDLAKAALMLMEEHGARR